MLSGPVERSGPYGALNDRLAGIAHVRGKQLILPRFHHSSGVEER